MSELTALQTAELVYNNGQAPITPMVNTDFSWVNQGTASIAVNAKGDVFLRDTPQGGDNVRLRVKTMPTPPFVVTAKLQCFIADNNYVGAGLCWRDSVTGKLVLLGLNGFSAADSGVFLVQRWFDSPTLVGSNNRLIGSDTTWVWLRIEDNGASRIAYASKNGMDWILFDSENRLAFMTANQIGIWLNNNDNAGTAMDAGLLVQSWENTP